MLHTTDGGNTWNKILDDYSYKFTKLFFKNALNGFAIDGNDVFKTSDGGLNWASVFTSPGEAINDFQFTSSNNLYTCGSEGAIYNSPDNGNTWTPLYKTATHGSTISFIQFPDIKHGWLFSNSLYLLSTSDSGNTWADRTPSYSIFQTNSMDFTDSLRGWVVGLYPAGSFGQILHTVNGGMSYNFQLNTGNYSFISVNFSDSLHGLAGTTNRTIYYTSNGGATWDSASIPSSVNYQQVRKLQRVDDMTGYAIASNTYNTYLAKTINGGQSWDTIKTDRTQFTSAFTDLHFIDAQHGYVSVFNFNGTPNKCYLIATSDGGQTWDTINYPSNLPADISLGRVNKVYFSDMMHGWVAGGGFSSYILHTDNGGATWATQESGSNVAWYDMAFINPQTAYVAGWEGNIARMSANTVLPVTWLNFNGILRNEQAVLTWSTANENNNKGYEVQKSIDGQTFAAIGFVAGAGNSLYMNTYKFDDAKLLSGANYYRLKQIDLDGKFNFSSVIKLDFTRFNWLISDNPVTSNSWVQVQLDKTANVSIQVISTAGNIIKTISKGKIVTGTYSIPLDLSNAAKGMYVIKLLVDDKVFTKKIIK